MAGADQAYRELRIGAQDGLKLHVRDYGDRLAPGVPLLCLGGLTRNAKDFDHLARRLCGGRRVVCPDYRGRGRSDYDPDWRHYRPETYLRDLAHIMAACNLHRVAVCGTSMGGLLAMAMGLTNPAALAGVILNDVGPDLNPGGLARIMSYVGVDRPQADWDGAIAHLKELFGPDAHRDEATWRRFAEATYRRADDGLLHYDWDVALVKPLLRGGGVMLDLWRLYGALRPVPVLALRGALSDLLSEATFERMAAVKPDLIRVTVPDVGHTPELDEPIAEQAIDDFLARIDGPGAD